MRKVKKWRFYCDFCKKAGCSGGHVAKHEAGCTRNPARVCGMCAKAKLDQKPTTDLLAALNEGGIDAVLTLARGCPACAMAAIHAYRKTNPLEMHPEEGAVDYIEFDYKTAAAKFWDDVNSMEGAYA